MKRLALSKLIKWKDNSRRKPLVVWGARQVGKTYLIKEIFAKEFYKDNYVYDVNSKILTIPLYEVFLLASDLSNGEFDW